MRIFKAELWNLELILPLFEQYRCEQGMSENAERALSFLANRIHFSESILFIAVDDQQQAVGFVQLYPRLSSLRLQRYWQLTDIFASDNAQRQHIMQALLQKSRDFVSFTQSNLLVVESTPQQREFWQEQGFKLNPNKGVFEVRL
ncbi:GNAT family N-acetyltransferase [Testudinibacter sp. TR-2022]|uniref:GNAT family N-acetyltransferase n=1 Tax=Testudinibacter sp. TR-2022 TaxID=2585029 RepID=UPI00111BBD15|nr:GNAT family N-acetyltransferase [Testudinibacter sp. TR-2022]TNH04164.1 GNAT family N-acetyltransferase [Pasteurellaceae bacterium Phil31]TNH11884.1 GNAT family N-acetyltransferase [Testudinibacter sp. TR-2022]TNH12581.1 GNAT family N-acetyltransferase [Testudinibacter sp. TR-2022]TNH16139.1 GNAT family N-acetyltransferase [Testudinibacter sp. TR-2022]TNH18236.1 GNAT family N-acetyltransferase [Testudinibacter sp. TR-2022]